MSIYRYGVMGAAAVYAAPGVTRVLAGYARDRTLEVLSDFVTSRSDLDRYVREERLRMADDEMASRTYNREAAFEFATSEVADFLEQLPGSGGPLRLPYATYELDAAEWSRKCGRRYRVHQRTHPMSLLARRSQETWWANLPGDVRQCFYVSCVYTGDQILARSFRWFSRLQNRGLVPGAWGSEYPTPTWPLAEAKWDKASAEQMSRESRLSEEELALDPGMFGDGTPPARSESEFWSRLDRNDDPCAYSKALDRATRSGFLGGLVCRLTGDRLRRRGRATKALEHVGAAARILVGAKEANNPLPGWWTPDLAGKSDVALGVSYLINQVGVATVKGAGAVLHPDHEGKHWTVVQVSLTTASEVLTASPQLLAFLASHVAFRPRTVELIASLRSRALHWAKKYDVPWEIVSTVLPGSVALAFMMSTHEKAAVRALNTREVAWAAETSSALRDGNVELSSGMTRNVVFQCRKWLTASSWLLERGLGAPVVWPVGLDSK